MEKISADVFVIGGGPGGYTAAIRLAQLGKKVVLADKEGVFGLGGECLLRGCIPSKTLIHSADVYKNFLDGEKIGVSAGDIRADLGKIVLWKNKVVKQLNLGINFLFKEHKIQVLKGTAFFESGKIAIVETENGRIEVEFGHAVIASGSKPVAMKGFEFDGVNVLSSKEALDLTELPNELVVVGGGYIGLELGTFFSKLESRVKIVEGGEMLLSGMDSEIVDVVFRNLEKKGIEFHFGCRGEKFRKENGKLFVEVFSERESKRIELPCDKILVAIGRKPNASELKLENTKVELNEKGFIKVNGRMQTGEENIYAIGDIVGNPMLAHKAYREAKVCAENICGLNESFDNKTIPMVVYSEPEIAVAGLNETEAVEKGLNVIVGKFPLKALGRALTVNEPLGFVKIVAEKDSHKILGCQIVGFNASDLIGEIALAMELNASLEDLAKTIHPHPSFGEALAEAAEVALGKDIHTLNK